MFLHAQVTSQHVERLIERLNRNRRTSLKVRVRGTFLLIGE